MDDTDQARQQPVSIVISEIVKSNRVQDFEAWIKEINHATKQFSGFLGVDIIRPRSKDHPEYVVILRFDSYDHFEQVQESPEIQVLIEKSKDMILGRSIAQKASGMELWFTLPDKQTMVSLPARYKMVIISCVVIYCLILSVNFLLSPITNQLPSYLAFPISIVVMSWLMTYPIMPLVTRMFDFWLYPAMKE